MKMSTIKENISFIIVTFKSDTVIDKCIESIGPNFPIIVVENSLDVSLKKKLESSFEGMYILYLRSTCLEVDFYCYC